MSRAFGLRVVCLGKQTESRFSSLKLNPLRLSHHFLRDQQFKSQTAKMIKNFVKQCAPSSSAVKVEAQRRLVFAAIIFSRSPPARVEQVWLASCEVFSGSGAHFLFLRLTFFIRL